MAKVKGADAFSDRLKRMRGPRSKSLIDKALFAGGEMIRVEAQNSMTEGAVSGKYHVPSAPGSPPMNDTGHLKDNIVTTKSGHGRVAVTSNASYSAALEFGTSKMAARPFMKRAALKKQKAVTDLVGEAVTITTK